MYETDFRRARLSGAYLNNGLMGEADLRNANLLGANLSRGQLYEANFGGADMGVSPPTAPTSPGRRCAAST